MGEKLFGSEDILKLFRKMGKRIDSLECLIEKCCEKAVVNIGSGIGIYKDFVNNNYRLKSLIAGDGIELTDNGNDITITSTTSVTCEDINTCLDISDSGSPSFFLNQRGDFVAISGSGFTCADLNTCDTDSLPEGATNLYFSNLLAISALNGQPVSMFVNDRDYITPGSSNTLTNKSGNISQWTNDSGYTTNTGTVTSVSALTLGTTGTDLSSSVANNTTTPTITLNVPTASASNRGVLSSSDWSLFNSKQAALGYTPENVANKTDVMSGNTASSTVYLSAKGVYDWVMSNTVIKLVTDHTSYPITGGTTEVIALAALIPANTVITNKSLEIGWRIIRSSGTAGAITPRLRVSTTAAPSPVSGASQLALGQVIGTSNNFEQLKRTLVYKSATATTMFPATTQAPSDDILSGGSQTTVNIDWTVNQYILFTIQNANNADISSLEHIDIYLV